MVTLRFTRHQSFKEKISLEERFAESSEATPDERAMEIIKDIMEAAKSAEAPEKIEARIFDFFQQWFAYHIQHQDKDLARFLKQGGETAPD